MVVEDFLLSEEASFIIMVDGDNILPLASSHDYKALNNGDTGPNTGSMGADCYVYTSFLYAGIMVPADGTLKVLAFDCRFGDPETQLIMLRLKSSIVDLCLAAERKELDQIEAEWDSLVFVEVVLVAGCYSGSDVITVYLPLQQMEARSFTLCHG